MYSKHLQTRKAFTLLEIMVGMAIGISLVGMVTISSATLFRDFRAANEYRNIHENARYSLAYLSRDIRCGISCTAFSSNDITLSILGINGTTNTVRYYLSSQNLMRAETIGGVTTTKQMTDNITNITFERYTNPGAPATTLADTYEIRALFYVTNSNARVASDLLQTRVLMRNKT
jgi:hypothetical protein